jgi:hypothetical protein
MEKFMTVFRKPVQENKAVEEYDQNLDSFDIDTEADVDDEDDTVNIKPLYLDDEPLSRELEYTPTKSVQIHYCLYKMVDDLNIPFLQFYMEKKEGEYSFPLFVTAEQGIDNEKSSDGVVDTEEDSEESTDDKLEPMEEPESAEDTVSMTPVEPESTEPVTTEPVTTEPVTTEPVTTETESTETESTGPVSTEPVTTEPVTTEPVTTEPVTTEPVTTEPESIEPVTTEPVSTEPVTTEPVTTEPVSTEPVTTEPVTTEPVTTEPESTEPVTTEPVTTEPVTTEHVTTEPVSTETDIIYNLCKEFFMKCTSLKEDESSKRYKGFVEIDTNNFVVVFNCTDLEINTENHDTANVILDEITNKKVIETPIAEFVTKFFEEHEYMKYVTDENNYPIPTPSCLYMVDIIDGNKENVIKSQNTMSILDIQVEHPIFGNIYLFSSKPLEINTQIGRYSVFTNKSLYMMNRDFELDENLREYKHEFDDFSVVCFFEEGVKYYAVYTQTVFMEI